MKDKIEQLAEFVLSGRRESFERQVRGIASDAADMSGPRAISYGASSLATAAAEVARDAEWIEGYEEAIRNVLALLAQADETK